MTRIYVMGLIFDENYRDIEDFYDFVINDLGGRVEAQLFSAAAVW